MNTEYKYTGTVYTGGAAHPLCKVSANSIKVLKLSANSAAKAFGENKGRISVLTDCGKRINLNIK